MESDVEDFLEHFGVRGMKWGHRRQQSQSSRTTYKKPAAGLSNKELKRRVQRMNMEKTYADLNGPRLTQGQQFTRELLRGSGAAVITASLGAAAGFFVSRQLRGQFGDTPRIRLQDLPPPAAWTRLG